MYPISFNFRGSRVEFIFTKDVYFEELFFLFYSSIPIFYRNHILPLNFFNSGLVSCFLNVHPHGATMDYLWSYLSQLMTVRPREVEDLFDRMPDLFRQEVAGCGATLERRWVFIGFQKESA